MCSVHHKILIAASCALALQFGNASAAPSTAEEFDAQATRDPLELKSNVPAGSPQLPAGAVPKAVELLLQMQGSSPADRLGAAKAANEPHLRAGSRAAGLTASGGRSTPAPDEVQGSLDDLKQSVLGGAGIQGDRPGGDGRGRQEELSQRYAVERGDLTSARSGVMSSPGQAGGGSILDWPVIRFIRENRALVLGVCLAALVGAWAAANVRFHRTRR